MFNILMHLNSEGSIFFSGHGSCSVYAPFTKPFYGGYPFGIPIEKIGIDLALDIPSTKY